MIKSFLARLLHEATPYGRYSRYTTVSLKLLEATSSSCIVLPCISIPAIMLLTYRVFRGALKIII